MDAAANESRGGATATIVWVVAVLLVIGVWVGAYALRGGGQKVVLQGWADGLPAGLEVAEAADKPMVLLFTAGWCPPCQSLKNNELSDAEVQAVLMNDYVPVQIDLTDQSPGNPNMEVAMLYGIEFLPTVVVTTPSGELIERYVGDRAGPWFARLGQ